VAQALSGSWDVVRGPHNADGDYWHSTMWMKNEGFQGGSHAIESDARGMFASLTPAQLAAPVSVEVK
jgi:hypothetical protein